MLRSSDIDFDKVISNKPTSKDKTFLVYTSRNNQGNCRLGISIPKTKVKNAALRNKLKRVIRHQLLDLQKSSIDIVMIYTGIANKYDAKLISNSLQFHKQKIIKTAE